MGMTRFVIGRILRGLLSVVIVVGIVMVLIYGCMDRNLIFARDSVFSRQKLNAQQVYKMEQWEKYGYVDYVSYADYLTEQLHQSRIFHCSSSKFRDCHSLMMKQKKLPHIF